VISRIPFWLGAILLTSTLSAEATLLDFEDAPDLTAIGDLYNSSGVTFANAIALTAGFSLNEFDYPPSSGVVAVGDDFAPIEIAFSGLANDISAYFTYASQLTFLAYDAVGGLIGTYVHPGVDNLGSTELIPLAFSDISALTIAGEWDGSYIMDDLSFSLSPIASTPNPSTLALFAVGIAAGFAQFGRGRSTFPRRAR
jgi:hypothetical protein